MLRNMIVLGLLIGIFAAVPLIYQANPDALRSFATSSSQTSAPAVVDVVTARPASIASSSGRKVEISADDRGHYSGEFKINGRKIDALIDTGATAVAMNVSMARKLGVHVLASDMTNIVNTANGKAKATVVKLDRVEIGRITVEDVPAIVLDDSALGTTLIGMTFLSRLKKFEADGKTLELTQ